MRIAAAIVIAVSGLYFAAVPTSAEATAVVRGGNCFSGVSSDETDAKEECARAGFSCTSPKVMRCYFDNGRHMFICQCKDPPKTPRAQFGDNEGRPEVRPKSDGQPQVEPPPETQSEPPPEMEPRLIRASAPSC